MFVWIVFFFLFLQRLKIPRRKRLLDVNVPHVSPVTYKKLAPRGFVVDPAAGDRTSISTRARQLHTVCVSDCGAREGGRGRGAELSHTGNSRINFLWPLKAPPGESGAGVKLALALM